MKRLLGTATLLAACGGSPTDVRPEVEFPALHGTYTGTFEILARSGLHTYQCAGPAIIQISSTLDREIEGEWDFGPNIFEPPQPAPSYWHICSGDEDNPDWHRWGTLAGRVERDDSLTLTFLDYEYGEEWLPLSFGGTGDPVANTWSTAVKGDSLHILQVYRRAEYSASWRLTLAAAVRH